MNAVIKDGMLVITIPHNNLKAMPESATKLSYSLASSGGNQAVSIPIAGTATVVKIGINAFIPIPGRKVVNGITIDTKTGQPV